jgi:CheY-like chemotaxis protein
VLAAEDNEFNRLLLREILTVQGVVLELAKDGAEATEKALQRPFDVILMDLHMPRLDGWDAASNIREQLGDKAPRIIALTADVFGEPHSEAASSPFDAWILKPIDAAQLVAELGCLERGQATAVPPGSTSDAGTIDDASGKGEGACHPADLQQRCINEMTSLTQQAMSVLTEGDLTVLQRYTHDLLGIAGVMGFAEMAEIAAEVNSAAKAHDIDRATQLLQALDAKLSHEHI